MRLGGWEADGQPKPFFTSMLHCSMQPPIPQVVQALAAAYAYAWPRSSLAAIHGAVDFVKPVAIKAVAAGSIAKARWEH